MTNYHLKPFTHVSSLDVEEKKAARKKLLEDVRKRRKIIYRQYREKRKQHSPIENYPT